LCAGRSRHAEQQDCGREQRQYGSRRRNVGGFTIEVSCVHCPPVVVIDRLALGVRSIPAQCADYEWG